MTNKSERRCVRRAMSFVLAPLFFYGCSSDESSITNEECPDSSVQISGIESAQVGRLVRSEALAGEANAFLFVPLASEEEISLDDMFFSVRMEYQQQAIGTNGPTEAAASCLLDLQSSSNLADIVVRADRELGSMFLPNTTLEDAISIIPRFLAIGADPGTIGPGPESSVPLRAYVDSEPVAPLAFVLYFTGGSVVESAPHTFSITVALDDGSSYVTDIFVPNLTADDSADASIP